MPVYFVSVTAVVHTDVIVEAVNEEQARELAEEAITRERICGLTTAEFSIGDVDADEVSEMEID
jgi:hypothetical protein